MRRTIVLCLAAAATLIGSVSAEGATKRPGKRAATPVRKLSSTEVLANQLAFNSRLDGEPLANACRASSFKNLAIALNMNSTWLTAPKGEFETSEEYSNRLDKVGSAVGRRQLVICEPLDDNPDIAFSYEADDERFAGSFTPSHNVWRDVKQLGT